MFIFSFTILISMTCDTSYFNKKSYVYELWSYDTSTWYLWLCDINISTSSLSAANAAWIISLLSDLSRIYQSATIPDFLTSSRTEWNM